MRKILAACIPMAMMVPSVAIACSPIPREPPLPNESDEAYRARIAAADKEQADRWAKERQERALEADLIFIARNRDWTPPDPPQPRVKSRPGQAPQPVPPLRVVPVDPYNSKFYFKPVAWFRGDKVTDLFLTHTSMTTCGFMGFGDVDFPKPGDLFVFFARKTPLTEDTLIDAIALDKIDNPALVDFVSKYRVKK